MSIIFKRNRASIYIFCHFTVDYSFHHQLWLENKTIDIVLIKILFIRADNQTATENRANIQRGNDPYEWANGYSMRDAKIDKTLSR